jgi:NTP pyrophosphatase (non-canonical NTP hydrolase)
MPTYYRTLREANVVRQREWDDKNQIDLSYRSNELVGEVGEALENAVGLLFLAIAAGRVSNIAKKLERERMGIRGSRATKDELAKELADVVICADLIAMKEGIDLDMNVAGKFNETSIKNGLDTRYDPKA